MTLRPVGSGGLDANHRGTKIGSSISAFNGSLAFPASHSTRVVPSPRPCRQRPNMFFGPRCFNVIDCCVASLACGAIFASRHCIPGAIGGLGHGFPVQVPPCSRRVKTRSAACFRGRESSLDMRNPFSKCPVWEETQWMPACLRLALCSRNPRCQCFPARGLRWTPRAGHSIVARSELFSTCICTRAGADAGQAIRQQTDRSINQ